MVSQICVCNITASTYLSKQNTTNIPASPSRFLSIAILPFSCSQYRESTSLTASEMFIRMNNCVASMDIEVFSRNNASFTHFDILNVRLIGSTERLWLLPAASFKFGNVGYMISTSSLKNEPQTTSVATSYTFCIAQKKGSNNARR